MGLMELGFDSPGNCSHAHHCSSFDCGEEKKGLKTSGRPVISPTNSLILSAQLLAHSLRKDVNQATLLHFSSACCW